MRKTIYATFVIASVMAITLPAAAQADEVCFGENSVMSAPPAISKATVTSPEPGALTVGWTLAASEPQNRYTSVVLQIHEAGNFYFKEQVEVAPASNTWTFHVAAGSWTVTGYGRHLVNTGPPYGWVYDCHSPIQALGGASVAPIKVAPLRAARRSR